MHQRRLMALAGIACAALTVAGCSGNRSFADMFGTVTGTAKPVAIDVEMTKEPEAVPAPPARKRSAVPLPRPRPAAAPGATVPAASTDAPGIKKHGRLWRMFHRKKAKEDAARTAVERIPPIPALTGPSEPPAAGVWPKQ